MRIESKLKTTMLASKIGSSSDGWPLLTVLKSTLDDHLAKLQACAKPTAVNQLRAGIFGRRTQQRTLGA
jgi:hypothetical protein